MDITVYIPTRGRISLEHITINEMKKFSSLKPVVVCPPSEENHYKNYTHADVMVCPLEGIGPTRQFILENSPTRGVIMLDDDMYFSKRSHPTVGGTLERITNLDPLFTWISEQMHAGFIHGGISARQGNQNIDFAHTDCIRVDNAHFFDAEVYRFLGLRFDTLPVMEDFYITLKLLEMGYPNRVSYEYCWSQRGSGAKGGCSLYRTAAVQAQAAELLNSIFPSYVKIVEKASDSQQGVMAKRKDVNIAWLKLWQDYGLQANRELIINQIHVAHEFQTKRRV